MTTNPSQTPHCVACDRTSLQVPLVTLEYNGRQFWICPQHLPMLIHDPKTLTGRLPGAEGMEAATHHD